MMVKVMTYNIRHGVGMDQALDLKRISEVIQTAGAEVIGLQEVDQHFDSRSDFKDQAKELAKLLGYHYCFGGNLIIEDGKYGNAILSKYPIMRHKNTLLYSGGEERRGLLQATLDIRGEEVHLFNTHLALRLDIRLKEVEEIIEVMEDFSTPKILMGDFNTTPDQEDYQYLLKNGKLKDVLDIRENTFPSTEPKRRIDYILVSQDISSENAQVTSSLASDHLPISVDLSFKND